MSITAVIVDNREPQWTKDADYGVPATVSQLDAGDVWAATDDGAMLIIERKEPGDLLQSIADGRLFDQAARMVQQSPWSYVVVTGELRPTAMGTCNDTGWRYSAVMGALLTVQELGVMVVHCAGRNDFAPCVQRIAGRSRKNLRMIHGTPRGVETIAPGAGILASFPGIGPERALSLLEHLPGAGWGIQYLTDTAWNGEHITGIGNGTRQKVREALNLEPEHMLAVIRLDAKEEDSK